MRTASISIDGEEIARATIRDDVAPDQLAITVLKAIRDVPAPRKTRRDKGKRKLPRGAYVAPHIDHPHQTDDT